MTEFNLIEIEELRKNALELIGAARTEEAILLLKKYLSEKDKELFAQLILISNRFFGVKQKRILGLGNKEKALNKINYNLIIFINHLEYNLTEKKEEPSKKKIKARTDILNVKSIVGSIVLLTIFWVSNKFLLNPIDNDKNTYTSEMSFSPRSSSLDSERLIEPIKKKIKLILIEKHGIADTNDYYISERLIDIKKKIIKKYKLEKISEENTNAITSYSNMDIEDEGWFLKRGTSPIPESDEELPLRLLVKQGKLDENDELSLHHKINATSSRYTPPMNSGQLLAIFSDDSGIFSRDMLVSNFAVVNLVGGGYYTPDVEFLFTSEQLNIFYPNMAFVISPEFSEQKDFILPKDNSITNTNSRNNEESEKLVILNKFGLKGEDEILIESEEDENEDTIEEEEEEKRLPIE